MNIKKIASKIAKLLALANSPVHSEAEAAKRQANALLNKYNLTMGDVRAASVADFSTKTGTHFCTPSYFTDLGSHIALAFGCFVVFVNGRGLTHSMATFCGMGIKPELAGYTFDVLRRNLARDRKAYADTLTRFKPNNRKRMLKIFSEAWVSGIRKQINDFAQLSPEEKDAIELHIENLFPGASSIDRKPVSTPKTLHDLKSLVAGLDYASKVNIRKPIHRGTKQHSLTNGID